MLLIEERSNYLYAKYEPGNGTSYQIVAFPWPGGDFQALGNIGPGGWLVICGLTGRSYLFRGEGFLHRDYIMEKFGLSFRADGDLLARLVGIVVGDSIVMTGDGQNRTQPTAEAIAEENVEVRRIDPSAVSWKGGEKNG